MSDYDFDPSSHTLLCSVLIALVFVFWHMSPEQTGMIFLEFIAAPVLASVFPWNGRMCRMEVFLILLCLRLGRIKLDFLR